MEKLTKVEEKIMQILWDTGETVVRDVIKKMGKPIPPYSTVSSVVRILEKKGFLDHKAYGKTHVYFPIISKKDYRKFEFANLVSGYFEDSYENIVSFMVQEKKLSKKDLNEMLNLITEKMDDKK